MVVAQPAAIGVERQLADPRDQVAIGNESAALARCAKAQVFQLDQHGNGEAVVDRRVLDVGRGHAGFGKSLGARPARARGGEVEIAASLMLDGLAGADQLDQWAFQRACDLRPCHDQGAAAIGDDAAIEPVQGVGDHRRIEHILHRQHLAQQRIRVVLGMVRSRHLDPGELLAGRAVLMHMALGAHRIAIGVGDAVGIFPLEIGLRRVAQLWRNAGGHAFAARPSGQRDQRDIAFACRDRLRCMADQAQVGSAADVGRIDMARPQIQIFDHRGRAHAGRVGRAEISVDVVLAQTGIEQRTLGDFSMQLRHRTIRGLARRVLIGADDISLAMNGHALFSVILLIK